MDIFRISHTVRALLALLLLGFAAGALGHSAEQSTGTMTFNYDFTNGSVTASITLTVSEGHVRTRWYSRSDNRGPGPPRGCEGAAFDGFVDYSSTSTLTKTYSTDKLTHNQFICMFMEYHGHGQVHYWYHAQRLNLGTPTVTIPSTSPKNNIQLRFNHAVYSNGSKTAFTAATAKNIITLKQNNSSGSDIAFSASISSDKRTITITPSSNLTGNTYVALSNGYYNAFGRQGAAASKTVAIDTTKPTISSMAFTSTGPYSVGEVITLAVTFSEPVTITTNRGSSRPPQIALEIGSSTKDLNATASATAKTTHNFTYTVSAGDSDSDGIRTHPQHKNLSLNGDAITDRYGNTYDQGATPTNLSTAQAAHKVDTARPTVSSIAFASSGPYAIGDVISVTTTFSENVVIGSGSTRPYISLVIGLPASNNSYRSLTAAATNTASTTHNFSYTVQEADEDDTDGVEVADHTEALFHPLIDVDSHIKDEAGNAYYFSSVPALPRNLADHNSGHEVDSSRPTVSSIAFTSSGPYVTGDVITMAVTFSEAVTVTTNQGSGTYGSRPPQIALQIGSTTRDMNATASATAKTTHNFTYTVQSSDNDSNGIRVHPTFRNLSLNSDTIADVNGNHYTQAALPTTLDSDQSNHKVDNTGPTITITAPTTGGRNGFSVTFTFNETTSGFGADDVTVTGGIASNFRNTTSGTVWMMDITPTANAATVTVAVPADIAEDALGNSNSAATTTTTTIDTTKPTLSSMAFTSTGPYGVGDVITLAVTFSEPVTLTTNQGNSRPPQIALEIGSNTRDANATASATAKATHNFTYTVVGGDSDSDGIRTSPRFTRLSLNGDTIADPYGNTFDEAETPTNLSTAQAAHKVDTTAPTVSSVAYTSTGPYGVGKVITLQLTFSEAVTIGPNAGHAKPTEIGVRIGSKEAALSGTPNSALSTTHNWTYTVVANDSDDNGIALYGGAFNRLWLNGDTIADEAGNAYVQAALPTGSLSGNTAAHKVETTAPTVSSIAFTSSGPYSTGDAITLQVTFSEAVTIGPNEGHARPTQIGLVIGTSAVALDGSPNSALSTTHNYTYTVQADDVDANGVRLFDPGANNLNLNGDTIADAAGNAYVQANLPSGLSTDQSDHKITADTTAPTVSSIAITSTGPYKTGDSFVISVTFSEPVTVTTNQGSGTYGSRPPQIALEVGSATRDTNATASATAKATHNFTYTIASTDSDTNGIRVHPTFRQLSLNSDTIADAAGNAYVQADLPTTLANDQTGHHIDNTAPTVSSLVFTSTGPYGIGDDIIVRATFNEKVTMPANATMYIGIGDSTPFDQRQLRPTAPATASTTHDLKYTVQATDKSDSNGISTAARVFLPGSGNISDEAGNHHAVTGGPADPSGGRRMDATLAAFPVPYSAHKIDTTRPTITGLVFTSAGPYGLNDEITLQATFSKAVTTSPRTPPSIPLTIGSTTRHAFTITTSASTRHTFSYVVAATDLDNNGIQILSTTTVGQPGGVTDTLGNSMTATALPDTYNSHQSSHTVDGSTINTPVITGLAVTSSGPYNAGDVITVQATFNKKVTIGTGTAAAIPLTIGSNTRNATAARQRIYRITHNFTYTVVAADSDTDGIQVLSSATLVNPARITDADSLTVTTGLPDDLSSPQSSHKVDNAKPVMTGLVITSTGPYKAGDAITLRVTFDEPVLSSNNTSIIILAEGAALFATGRPLTTPSSTLDLSYTVRTNTTQDSNGIRVASRGANDRWLFILTRATLLDEAGNGFRGANGDNGVPIPANLVISTDQSGHTIDSTAPTADILAITSTGPYSSGDVITVRATFSEAVVIGSGNAPTVPLTIGSNTRNATAAATTTASNRHNFSYTVSGGDTDSDGIQVLSAARVGNPGSIADTSGNTMTNDSLPNHLNSAQSSHTTNTTADTTAPTVSSLAFISSGPYGLGDVITLGVTFNEPVTIGPNEGHGTPMQIGFSMGSSGKAFDGVPNTTLSSTQHFTYTVAANDNDSDGIAVWSGNNNQLWLNGDTIADGADNAYVQARLPETLSSNQSGHKVETTAPGVSSLAFTSTGPYGIGDDIVLRVTFNEKVTITTGAGATVPPQIILDIDGYTPANPTPSSVAKTTYDFTYTVQEGDTDTNGTRVRHRHIVLNNGIVADEAGNRYVRTNNSIPGNLSGDQSAHKVDGTVPTISGLSITSTGPYTSGDTITLQATFSEAVTISSGTAAAIPLTIGSSTRNATAASTSSASTTHNFSYTVAATDVDSNGIQVVNKAVLANAARITDAADNAVATALPDTLHGNQRGHIVTLDTTKPVVTGLAIVSSGPYKQGDTITIRVTFDEPVTTSWGVGMLLRTNVFPQIAIAPPQSTLGRTLDFAFPVKRNTPEDSNGIQVTASSLLLQSRGNEPETLLDAAGNGFHGGSVPIPANLSLAANQSGHEIDKTAPTVSSIALTSSGPYAVNDEIVLQATFSEKVTIGSGTAAAIPLTIGSNSRNATAASTTTASSTHNFSYSVVAADTDSDGIQVLSAATLANPGRISDLAGHTMTATALPDNLNSTQSSHTVDGSQSSAATITGLSIASSGPYKTGDVITLRAMFSKKVTIASGTAASIPLTIGSNTRAATAAVAATASSSHNFTYTVVAADADSNGIQVLSAATLSNPARVVDESNTAMTSTALPDTLNSNQSGHSIDTTAPTVSSIAIASTGPYKENDVINVTVTFSEAVTIGSTRPGLSLALKTSSTALAAGHIRTATAAATSTASTTHNFSYTVASTDNDSDGIQVGVHPNSSGRGLLTAGAIRDAAGNSYTATTQLPRTLATDQSSHKVDTTAPTITSMAFISRGTYGLIDGIILQVTFSEAVVISSGTAPSIPLVIGSNTRNALAVSSATASTTHNFRYFVLQNDTDTDGIQVSSSATLANPARIADAAGNALTGTALPDNLNSNQSDHKVDGNQDTVPTVRSLAFTSSGPYRTGDVITLQVTFSERVRIGPNAGHIRPPQIGLSIGDKGTSLDGRPNSPLSLTHNFTYTVVAGDNDGDGISLFSGNNNRLWLNGETISDNNNNDYVQALLPTNLSSNQSAHKVDTAKPTVTGLAITSSGPYKSDDTIRIRATFNEPVVTTGNVGLFALANNSALYASTNGSITTPSRTIDFSYRVRSTTPEDNNGIQVAFRARDKHIFLSTNGGLLRDEAGNGYNGSAQESVPIPANLALDNQAGHEVDHTAPTIASLAFATSGPYGINDEIAVAVTFSEAVVISSGTAPSLPLTVGSTTRNARAAATATASATHNFSYTVAASDMDSNGVQVLNAATLANPGQIYDRAGHVLTATALPDTLNSNQSGHTVDGSATTLPTITGMAIASDGPYKQGAVIAVQLTFSEKVFINSGTAAAIPLVIGSNTRSATATAGSRTSRTHNFTYTVQGSDSDSNGFQVLSAATLSNPGRITDAGGNAMTTTALPDNLNSNQTGHHLDFTAPRFTQATIASTGPYGVGDKIILRLTYSEKVTLPTHTYTSISLHDAQGVGRWVTIRPEAPSTPAVSHDLTHTVEAGDNDPNGISVFREIYYPHRGDILDEAGNAHAIEGGGADRRQNPTIPAFPDPYTAHKVDTTAPTISSLAITSTGPYATNDVITVQATFNEAVVINSGAAAAIPLTIGSNTRSATAAATATASTTHNFSYTVLGDDVDSDGIQVLSAATLSNPGRIVDTLDNVMTATALPDNLNSAQVSHKVTADTTASSITGLAFASTGPYGTGKVISIQATFSEAVTINSGTAPAIPLTIGSNTRTATAAVAATASTTHNFTYTVQDGDSEGDTILVAAAAVLSNPGQIVDSADNTQTATALPDSLSSAISGHTIDQTHPTVSSLSLASSGPYKIGDDITVRVTFNEPILLTGPATDAASVSVTIQSFARSARADSISSPSRTLDFTYRLGDGGQAEPPDTNGIQVAAGTNRQRRLFTLSGGRLTDVAGNAYDQNTFLPSNLAGHQRGHEVDPNPPSLSGMVFTSSGPYGVDDEITLRLTFSEAVIISSGTAPAVPLTIGTVTRSATASATNTASRTHNFSYTVVAADADSDGLQILNAATLANRARITDPAGNAVSSAALPDNFNSNQSSHIIDGSQTTLPTVTALALNSTGPYNDGDVIRLQATFSEKVTIGSGTAAAIPLRIGSNNRNATATATSSASRTHTFSYTVNSSENDTDGIQVLSNATFVNPARILDVSSNAMTATALPDTLNSAQSSHTVDNTHPSVSSAAISSTGPYHTGDAFIITVTFSEAVNLTTSTISPGIIVGPGTSITDVIRMDSNEVTTTPSSTHNFTYTVQAGDDDPNGISVYGGGGIYNYWEIYDAAGNNVLPAGRGFANILQPAGHIVDTVKPSLTGLAFSATGPYSTGDVITLQATFNEPLAVAAPLPTIPLQIGSTARSATASASGRSNSHNFTYTVMSDDVDSDGIQVLTSAVLTNPGSITEPSGRGIEAIALPDTLNHHQSNHTVTADTTAPTITAMAFIGGHYSLGDAVTVQLTFSEPVVINSAASIPVQIGSHSRTATVAATTTASSTISFTYTITANDNDSDGIQVLTAATLSNHANISDKANNALASAALPDNLNSPQSGNTVDLTAPNITALAFSGSGPYGVGNTITLQATFSEAVTIAATNAPAIPLTIGGNTRNATAAATNTASTTHNFTYTVVSGDNDGADVKVQTAAELVNPGSATDGSNATATALPDNLNTAQSGHKVDTANPTVAALGYLSSGPYKEGDVITLGVTFSEPVTIGPNQGHAKTTEIGFTLDNANRAFNGVENASLNATQRFTYTVAANENDTNGIAIWANNFNRLWLNGDTIADAAGNAYQQANLPTNLSSNQGGHIIDNYHPIIHGLSITSSGPYSSGDTITVRLTFSENVRIAAGTPPAVPLTIGSNTRNATAAITTSFGTTHNFNYTVAGADSDNDGIQVLTAATLANPQNVIDNAGNAVTAAALPDTLNSAQSSHSVSPTADVILPTIRSFAFVSSGTYGPGAEIILSVTFSEPVKIGSGTAAAIPLTIGSNTRNATAAATNTLSTTHDFTYTIASNDADSDGIQVLTAATLANPGRISDAANNVMTATALPDTFNSTQSSHKVDGSSSTIDTGVVRMVLTSSGPYDTGDVITVRATFNRKVKIIADPDFNTTAYIPLTIGSNTRNAVSTATETLKITHDFSYTVVSGDNDTDGIQVLSAATIGYPARILDKDDYVLASDETALPDNLNSAQSGHRVNSSRPTVTGLAIASTGPYLAGDVISLTVTFSEAVTNKQRHGGCYSVDHRQQ